MLQRLIQPEKFYYLIDLHYSQTQARQVLLWHRFYYLIDLHYSQTQHNMIQNIIRFTTL